MLRVGETIGQYEILAKLKAGGMATLFLGRKTGASGFSRHVAVKVVHEHLASDPDFVRMFIDEALLQSHIHHPNVVHVEELGQAQGTHFLVMEYVHGCSLAQMLDALARRSRRPAPDIAVHIVMQTLAGLHAAHELKDVDGTPLGVVHRDVSPQNVLLAYEGHVKLIDFGVAKARNRSQQTTGASLKGKLRYMAPEQAFGADIDRRADVYALGVVLWEMLAFRKLFHAKDDLQLLDLVRAPRVKPPSLFAPGIPPSLDAVVMTALAPKAENRYATAQDFRRALAEAMPRAMLIDAANVADLLVAVMGEQMKQDRDALPSQLSAVAANDRRRDALDTGQAEEALLTMTASATGLGYLEDIPVDLDASPSARITAPPAERVTEPPGPEPATRGGPAAALPWSPVDAGSSPAPRDFLQPPPSTATPLPTPITALPPAASRLPWLAAGAALLLVLAVVGAYVGLSHSAPEPIARQLAPEPSRFGTASVEGANGIPSTPAVPPGSHGIEEPAGLEVHPPVVVPAVVAAPPQVAAPAPDAPEVAAAPVVAPAQVVPPRADPPSADPPSADPVEPRPRRTRPSGRPSHADVPLASEW